MMSSLKLKFVDTDFDDISLGINPLTAGPANIRFPSHFYFF